MLGWVGGYVKLICCLRVVWSRSAGSHCIRAVGGAGIVLLCGGESGEFRVYPIGVLEAVWS